jgi:hypothetical protein
MQWAQICNGRIVCRCILLDLLSHTINLHLFYRSGHRRKQPARHTSPRRPSIAAGRKVNARVCGIEGSNGLTPLRRHEGVMAQEMQVCDNIRQSIASADNSGIGQREEQIGVARGHGKSRRVVCRLLHHIAGVIIFSSAIVGSACAADRPPKRAQCRRPFPGSRAL